MLAAATGINPARPGREVPSDALAVLPDAVDGSATPGMTAGGAHGFRVR
jgi:hypothetical protein